MAGRERSAAEVSARIVALDALLRIEGGAYAHIVLPEMLRRTSLADRDRAFTTDLVYGAVRMQRRLDDLVGGVSRRPVHRLDPPVRAALRLGAQQLLQGVPAHAAVGETVEALGARSPRAKGFANGVLRALTRLGPPWPEPDELATRLSYPDWVVARLTDDLGMAAAHGALAAMNEPAALTLRPNPRTATPDALEAELRSLAVDVARGDLVPGALVARGVGDPARLAAVRDGRATPQDQASQAVVGVLDVRSGHRVVDVAAAPGGKAGGAAERTGPGGLVVALDVDPGRTRLVARAARRLGLAWLHPVVADGRRPPLPAGRFDRVLVDAPCSGLGVLRRRPDARWRLDPAAIDALAALQRELLAAAATLVRVDGVLVYSVCTLTHAETVAIDEWAGVHLGAGAAAPFEAEQVLGPPWEPVGRGARLLPQAAGTDGMYVLRLRRVPPAAAPNGN